MAGLIMQLFTQTTKENILLLVRKNILLFTYCEHFTIFI